MYKVILINGSEETIVHYPTGDNTAPHLLKMNLVENIGKASHFSFAIPFQNVGYNELFDLITLVKITRDSDIVFEGRVLTTTQNMTSSGEFYKDVIAESELAYFNDTRSRAWDIKNMNVNDFITKVIDNHNLHTTSDKQFTKGNIQVVGSITCTTSFENSLNVLIDKMVDVLGVGHLVVRKSNNIRYLDYLPQISGTNADIILGRNMKDIAFTKDVVNVATRVIPVGKDNLTIESVNNGKDYLENTSAISEFGIIEQPLEFKDVTDKNILKSKGQAKLNEVSTATYKIATNVLDLSTLGLDPYSFNVGPDVRIINPVINFDETFTVVRKETDLLKPQNGIITVNDKFQTMTDRQVSLQRVSKYVDKILTADKQLNTFYLDGYINLLKNQMGAMADTAEKQLAKAILFEDKVSGSPTFGAMALGTQGFMIADTIINDEWQWSTFGTGKGFVADLIVAGHLIGGAVDFDLNQGKLKITYGTGIYTLMDGNGLKTTHNDGSYSMINGDGFTRYNGPTKTYYHCLNYDGEISIASSQWQYNTTTITLPSEFRGKDFNISYTVKSIQYGAMPTFLSSYWIYTLSKNIAAGTFQVKTSLDYYNIKYVIQGSDTLYAQDDVDYGVTYIIQYSVTA